MSTIFDKIGVWHLQKHSTFSSFLYVYLNIHQSQRHACSRAFSYRFLCLFSTTTSNSAIANAAETENENASFQRNWHQYGVCRNLKEWVHTIPLQNHAASTGRHAGISIIRANSKRSQRDSLSMETRSTTRNTDSCASLRSDLYWLVWIRPNDST